MRKSAFGLAVVVGCLEVWLLAMILAVAGCSSATPSPAPAVSRSVSPSPTPSKTKTEKRDSRFDTCAEAKAAGYGPYHKGDPEFSWYQDSDGDGVVCE